MNVIKSKEKTICGQKLPYKKSFQTQNLLVITGLNQTMCDINTWDI